MVSIEHNGYYPLTLHWIGKNVPHGAGVFTLAIQLPSGQFKTIFSKSSEDIGRALRALLEKNKRDLPDDVFEVMRRYQCYFTYFIIVDAHQREAIAKMLSTTLDPIVRLQMVDSN